MKTSSEEKTITVAKIGNEYHFKPFNNNHWKTAQIPVWIFDGYIDLKSQLRDVTEKLNSYFNEADSSHKK